MKPGDYDRALSHAKSQVTRALCDAVKDPDRIHDLATAMDDLSKAWDNLTDCLCRQRDERAKQITKLINEMAEMRK